jgi:hypothetical protein
MNRLPTRRVAKLDAPPKVDHDARRREVSLSVVEGRI